MKEKGEEDFARELVGEDVELDNSELKNADNWSLDRILSSMRKLREALLPLEPDEFGKRVFIFNVKVSVLAKSYQSYYPALIHLIERFDGLLDKDEKKELGWFRVLHLAHFNKDLNEAYYMMLTHVPGDRHVMSILRALACDDAAAWLKLYQREKSVYFRTLMSFSADKMVESMLRQIGKSYMQLTKPALESMVGLSWDELHKQYSCNWAVDNQKVIIRQRRFVKS
jgi:hypothetical protein